MRLDRLRNEIDGIDSMLLELFSSRMDIVTQVAQEKQRMGMPVDAPEREREILNRVADRADPDVVGFARVFFSAVFDISKAYQRSNLRLGGGALSDRIGEAIAAMPGNVFPGKAVVALPGVQGSFPHIACQQLFAQADALHCRDYRSVLDALGKGLCQFGILPLESSGYGSVVEVYTLLRESGCSIVRSTQVRMDYALLGLSGTDPTQVVEVFADARAVSQCGLFLKGNPSAKVTLCENSAQAVTSVKACERAGVAAIAPLSLAGHAGLVILSDEGINDEPSTTRYACIAKGLTIYPGADTLSLMLTLSDRPGALSGLAVRVAALDVTVRKLENRRLQEGSLMFADLEAEPGAPSLLALLDELSTGPEKLTFLGWHQEI